MNRGGVRDVVGEGMEGRGRGGRRQRVRLPLKDPISRRVPLRGRRRGVRAAKEEENKRLSLYMGHWLASNPPRQNKD